MKTSYLVHAILSGACLFAFSGCAASVGNPYSAAAQNEKSDKFKRDIAQKKYVQQFLKDQNFYHGNIDADYRDQTKTAWRKYVSSLPEQEKITLQNKPILLENGSINPDLYEFVRQKCESDGIEWINKVASGVAEIAQTGEEAFSSTEEKTTAGSTETVKAFEVPKLQ